MSVPKVETIIWDLDGTILDSFGVFQEALSEVLPTHGRALPSVEIMTRNYHGSLDDSINNILGGGLKADEVKVIVDDFLQVQNSHYEVVDHHLFADALNLAKRAHKKSVNQILVTNRNHEGRLNASPRSIVERSELSGLIDTIICGDDSQHRKPHKAVVEPLLDSGIVKPETTLVIGDQFVDGEFAKSLGARAVLVSRGPDQIVHMERLSENWQDFITVVQSLDQVEL